MNQATKAVLGVEAPKETCIDQKCPFHGQAFVKRELYTGKVIKRDSNRSATIEWSRSQYIPKYERYALRRSRMRVHNPLCINAQLGQEVLVARTRPLSKTKHHAIIQITGIASRPGEEEVWAAAPAVPEGKHERSKEAGAKRKKKEAAAEQAEERPEEGTA